MRIFILLLIVTSILSCKSDNNEPFGDCDIVLHLLKTEKLFHESFKYTLDEDTLGYDSLIFVTNISQTITIIKYDTIYLLDRFPDSIKLDVSNYSDSITIENNRIDTIRNYRKCFLSKDIGFAMESLKEISIVPYIELKDTLCNRILEIDKFKHDGKLGFIQFSKVFRGINDKLIARGEIYFQNSLIEVYYFIEITEEGLKLNYRDAHLYKLSRFNYYDNFKEFSSVARELSYLGEVN